jgi:uncharacterized protein
LDAPTEENRVSYQSDSWDDDGAYFMHTFSRYTELCGFSRVKLLVSCNELDDMDVYVIIRKLDKTGKPLLNYNIPFENQKPGTTVDDIPDENIYKYVGPSGRLRASKRATGIDPGLGAAKQALQDPTEVWYPHDAESKVPRGEVVELDIGIWPGGIVFEAGESLRLEIKGHDPILPEYASLKRNIPNLNVGRHVVHTGGRFQSTITLPFLQ